MKENIWIKARCKMPCSSNAPTRRAGTLSAVQGASLRAFGDRGAQKLSGVPSGTRSSLLGGTGRGKAPCGDAEQGGPSWAERELLREVYGDRLYEDIRERRVIRRSVTG